MCTYQASSKTVLNKYVVNFDVRGQQGMDFFTGGSVIMDYGLVYFGQKGRFKVKPL